MRSRLLAVSIVAVVLSLIAPAAFAVQTRATVDDVIKMWEAKMSDADIVASIERARVYAALSQEDITRLEEAGLSTRLIVAVDRTFTQMVADDRADDRRPGDSRYTRQRSRARRPLVYARPYYGPFHSPWHSDIGFSFGHRGFGHGGFGHGGGHRRRH